MISNLPLAKRINTIFALLVVFLLVLATNRIDQHHFETAQKSVNEVFEDRVLVQGYIFSISQLLQEKYKNFQGNTVSVKNTNSDVEELLEQFKETKLTKTEAKLLDGFKTDFKTLSALEQKNNGDAEVKKKAENTLNRLQEYLSDLSEIQITESRSLTKSAQKSLDVSEFMANLEIFFLIVIGVVLQVVVFYRSKKIAKAQA